MKKILAVVFFSLLFGVSAYSEKIVFGSQDFLIVDISGNRDSHYQKIFGERQKNFKIDFRSISIPNIANNYCKNFDNKTYLLGQKKIKFNFSDPKIMDINFDMDGGKTLSGIYQYPYKIRYFCAKSKNDALKKFRKTVNQKKFGKIKFISWLVKKGENISYDNNIIWLTNDKNAETLWTQKIISEENMKIAIEQKKQEEIMFTINDKREQCEAIGFKPETEKFADCVLRLVELDVKQQTQNQIAVAQNNGNDALVKQLKRQSDLQSSQALIDLGQQLMNPKRYNSNIYMPQTQRCTMQGFGTFATMRCR